MTIFIFNKEAVKKHNAMLLESVNAAKFGTPESIAATREALQFTKVICRLKDISAI